LWALCEIAFVSSVSSWIAGGVLFAVLATANGAGYRYGTSDQAFYIPAVTRVLDAAVFPRDATLIDAQGRLILTDEVLAGAARATGLPLDLLFFCAYLLSLAVIGIAIVLIGRSLYATPWLIVALGAAFTLRHRIPRTSVNSFEPYFHPRMLAFGLGALAVAALLRRRLWGAVLLTGVAALVHLTTALWFALAIGVAIVVIDSRWRRPAAVAAAAGALLGAWAMSVGPLRESLTTMDETWLRAVSGKDSLFASQWPAWAWAANLALMAILWWAYRTRRAQGQARAEDTGLVLGAAALVALFLVTFPAVVARVALPVQFQFSRVFWLVDFLATIYVIGIVRRERAAVILASTLLAVSILRGGYVMLLEHPERPLFAVGVEQSPWQQAMEWLRQQPVGTHVLADPGHGWKYGTSVRVSGERDVLLEEVKDSAIAIYSRDVAVRYLDRANAIGDFGQLTEHRAHELATQYELDYLVTEADLALPVAYRNQQFRVYSLR
jgi:hypothetical protein